MERLQESKLSVNCCRLGPFEILGLPEMAIALPSRGLSLTFVPSVLLSYPISPRIFLSAELAALSFEPRYLLPCPGSIHYQLFG